MGCSMTMTLNLHIRKKMKSIFTVFSILIFSFSFANEKETIQKIYVSNLSEFIAAINDYTEIIITAKELDLTIENSPLDLQYSFDFDAPRDKKVLFINHPYSGKMMIRNIQNLTISSSSTTKLFTKNTQDDVLYFANCKNIRLENLILVHEPEAKGACEGDVLKLDYVDNFTGINLELNGSGRVGLTANRSNNLLLKNLNLYHNSEMALSLTGCENAKIQDSEIRFNNLFELLYVKDYEEYDGKGNKIKIYPTILTLENTEIHHNDMERYFNLREKSKIIFDRCNFYENKSTEDTFSDADLNRILKNTTLTSDELRNL